MFSLPKLLVLILICVAVWYVYKAIQRRGVTGVFGDRPDKGPSRSQSKALDMEKCRICGDFVPADARACTRARCPFPAA